MPGSVRRSTLRHDESPGYSRTEWASVDESGALSIEGQSLSSSADPYEYEWAFSVAPDQVPRLVTALGGTAGEDVIPLLVRHCRAHHPPDFSGLMESEGVEFAFWSRAGD
jgi:hypothetical protein